MTARDDVITPASPSHAPTARATLDEVIVTERLYERPSRPADFKLENQALTALIEVMSQAPDVVLQKLADTALSLCNAGSAGISIAETDGPEDVFRWHATAGHYKQYLGGTMPRHFSPCGAVLEHDAPLLMVNMVRYYDYVSVLEAPPHEALLVPFYSRGEAIGTLWVVAHDGTRQFDREDLRILKSLTNFASMAVQAFARTHELERANLAARDAGELREHFIAVLGHDLRNPLGAIANSAALLERGAPAERLQSIGHIVGQSARRIGELIDNLLDFTRGRLGGGIQVNRTRLQTLEPALNDVVTELRTAYPGHAIESRFHFTAPVAADPDRIAQMVSNLLANALIHGDPAKPIRVEGSCDVDMLRISVANGGQPIPAEVMSKLFKPFERGTKNGNREGLGLGLYICSEIARAHGGELTVTSTGEETVFRFLMRQGT